MKFKLYTEHPYGNGYMLEPVTRGEHLHDEESDELMSFVGVSDDGKVIGKVGGKTIEVDPERVGGKILPADQEPVPGKDGFETERSDMTEAVHRLPGPSHKKGAPEPWERARAFDKVNPKTGARPDRSVLRNRDSEKGKYYAIEFSDEEDFIMVRVEGDGKEFSYGKSVPYGKDHEKDPWTEYYGVNVLFFPDGTIDAHTSDPTSKKQWAKDKDKIIKVAKDSLKDKDLPAMYDGLGGKSVKRGTGKLSFDPDSKADREHSDYHGYHDKKTNEGKLSFKEFLLVESKEETKKMSADEWRAEIKRRHGGDRNVRFRETGKHGWSKLGVNDKGPTLTHDDEGPHWEDASATANHPAGVNASRWLLGKYDHKKGTGTFFHNVKHVAEAADEKRWYKKRADWQRAVNGIDVDDDGRDWAKCDGKLVAKWDEEAQEGWVKMSITEVKLSDAKRLAKQDTEAIIKAKAEVAKARKSGDEAALAKAKKKLAALTEEA